MRSLRLAALAALVLPLVAGACNRGPAEAARREAEEAVAPVRSELESDAPDELASIDAALRSARADLARGRHTDALRIGQELPARIHAAVGAARARRDALAANAAPAPPPDIIDPSAAAVAEERP